MATLNIPIQMKGTEVAGRIPTAADLIERQLVMNLTDGRLWSKTSGGQVVQFGVTNADFSQVAFSGNYDDLTNKPNITPYTLPPSTAAILGGIKIGAGLNVTLDGTASAAVQSVQGQNGSAKTGVVTLTRADMGLDILDANNKIKPEYLPDSITGAMVYQGTWDASTNTPTIPPADSGNLGWLYVVAVPGTTTIDGNSTWEVGDWLISDGTVWQRVAALQTTVVSVNAKTGAVVLTLADFPDASTVASTGQYSDLLGIPTEFPPAAHTQPASTITGLGTVATSNDYNDLDNLPPNPATANVGFNAIGTPVLQGNVRFPFPMQIKFGANWVGSVAFFTLYTGTTATVQLNRLRAGTSTNVGSIQYVDSTGVVTFTALEPEPTFLAADQLEWVWPSNVAQFNCNMLGTRSA